MRRTLVAVMALTALLTAVFATSCSKKDEKDAILIGFVAPFEGPLPRSRFQLSLLRKKRWRRSIKTAEFSSRSTTRSCP